MQSSCTVGKLRLAGTVPGGLFACALPECLRGMSSACCSGPARIARRDFCRAGSPGFSVKVLFAIWAFLLQIHKCFSAAYKRSTRRVARALPQDVFRQGGF